MDNYVIENLTGTEGMFTYNFFCESLLGAIHSLLHAMSHDEAEPPEQMGQLPDMLSQIGTNLMDDYGHQRIDLGRLKNQLIEFYDAAFAVNEAMVPIVTKGSDETQYYYFIFEQGLKLMFTSLMENIMEDMPEGIDTDQLMAEIMKDFAAE